MTAERATRVWIVWHCSWAALVVGSLLLHVLWSLLELPGAASEDFWIWALSLMVYPVAAAVILINRPGNRVGRTLATVSTAAGVIFMGSWIVTTWRSQPWSPYLEAVTGAAVPVMFWGVIALLYIFPTGTIPRRVFRVVFVTFTVVVCVSAVLAVFSVDPLPDTGRPNPLAGPPWMAQLFDLGIVILVPGLLLGGWASISRYRRADREVRAQLRWFLSGIVGVAGLITIVAFLPEELSSPWQELTQVGVVAGFWSLPLAIMVAVTRYRLYEIDRVVSRTITYTAVVALLAGTYLGLVTVISGLLPTEDSLAVAISTLAVAALFNPLRRGLRSAVDKRFNRLAYEAEAVTDALSRRLREPLPGEEVITAWRQTVQEVFHPSHIGVWLAPGSPSHGRQRQTVIRTDAHSHSPPAFDSELAQRN
jgi:hypothetical protein